MRRLLQQQKWKTALVGVLVLVGCFSVFAAGVEPAFAQVNTELDDLALGDRNLLDIVQTFINIFLGILSLIAVVIVIYGGFMWMTAGGNADKIERAKLLLRNAAIGLTIILASWGIVLFVFSILSDATGTNTGDGGTGTGGGGTIPASSSSFYVLSTTPGAGEVGASLCAVQVRMSDYIDTATVTDETYQLRVLGGAFDGESCSVASDCGSGVCSDAGICVGDNVDGTIAFGPGESTKYFSHTPFNDLLTSTTYEGRVVGGPDGVLSKDTIDDGIDDAVAMTSDYTWTFTTGTERDEVPPTVVQNGNSPFPENGATDVCLNTPINFDFSEAMLITSFDDQQSFVLAENTGSAQWDNPIALDQWNFGGDFTFAQARPAEELLPFATYSTRLFGGDADNNFAGAVTDLCGNPLDGNENGVPEGSTVDNFFASESEESEVPITWNTGENAECTPIIENIDPTFDKYGEEGQEATVTVTGQYLGPHPEVEFQGSRVFAADGFNTCFDTVFLGNLEENSTAGSVCINDADQTNNTIRLKTPVGSTDSNIRISVAEETSDPAAQTIDVQSPYIAGLSPDNGAIGQYVTIAGDNFGGDVGTVLMRSIDGSKESTMTLPEACGNVWTNEEVVAVVPETFTVVGDDGGTGTWEVGEEAYIQIIRPDGLRSDLQHFTFSDAERPNLCEVVPQCSDTAGHSYTVTGEGFGDAQSGGREVVYTLSSDSTEYLTTVEGWSDVQVTGQTDGNMPQGEFYVSVYDGDGGFSNARKYEIPCSAGPEVAELSQCTPEAGIFPAPNPRPGEQNACINANIGVLFDQPLNSASLNDATVQLQQYNSGDNFDPEYSPIDVDAFFFTKDWRYELDGESYFGFQYNINRSFADEDQDGVADGNQSVYLQPDTWYEMTLTTGITNNDGVGMASNYEYRFKTASTGEVCQVDTVDVSPSIVTMNEYFDEEVGDRASQNYVANGFGANCALLDSSLQSWNWSIDDVTIGDFGKAGGSVNAGTAQQKVFVAGDDEENEGVTDVTASVVGDIQTDTAKFAVDLAFCSSDADCAQCSNGFGQQSVCNLETSHCTPVIQSFSPDDGKAGTWATIQGCMFGSSKGNVFWNADGQSTETVFPNAQQCDDTWTNTSIVVEVPESLPQDPHFLEVETRYGDKTSLENANGAPAFDVNDATHPGICRITPDAAAEGAGVTVDANSLGEEQGVASFAGVSSRVAAPADETNWTSTIIDSVVASGAVLSNNGFIAVTAGGDQQQCPGNDTFCSNELPFTVNGCSVNSDCGTGCCADSGICTDASFCSQCDTDAECSQGGQCGAPGESQCVNGQCSPVITDLYYDSGPASSPVTIAGCYFGNYNPESSSVFFGDAQANLFCNNGWANQTIVAEVPAELTVGESVSVTVNNGIGSSDGTQQFTVSNQCSNGTPVPDTGVPLLCDLNPGSGQYPSEDGDVSATNVDFYGDRFVDGAQRNVFIDAKDGTHPGTNLSVSSETKSSADVPSAMKSSGTAAVEVNKCTGNALPFNVACGVTDDCQEGSYCVDGFCTTSPCGFCSDSSSCGNNQGCYADSDLETQCCAARPTIEKTVPSAGRENVCPNTNFSIDFSEEVANLKSIVMLYRVYEDGELVSEDKVEPQFAQDPADPSLVYFQPLGGWEVTDGVDDEYVMRIVSNPDEESGVVSAQTSLAMLNGTQEYTFSLASSECAPSSMDLQNVETGQNSYTFTEPNATTNFRVSMLSSDGQLLQPTSTMGWQFAWSPYEDDQRCDNVAWVDLPTPVETEPTTEIENETIPASDASGDTQAVVSGTEDGGETAITVQATPTVGWEDGDVNDVSANIATQFCPTGEAWVYQDIVDDSLNQNFNIVYCTDTGLPRLDTTTITGGSTFDDFFRQYLFVNPNNEEQAFAIRVYENEDNLTPEEWYKRTVPNPGSVSTLNIHGYEAVRDGNTYYVAASNKLGDQLYNNIYLFTFNDEPQVLEIADQVMENIRFNTNVSYGECEASDKNKLTRDTKRLNDLGTIQLYANDFYSEQNRYPRPKSQTFGSYLPSLTTSVWPSWQGALGNIFGKTIPTDVYNFFLASENNTPWLADSTPWIDESEKVNDCKNEPSEDIYYDESGTCWDDLNKSFFCPENSYTYAWKVDPANVDDAQLGYTYARMEYDDPDGAEYATTGGLLDACDDVSNAECRCYNYAAVGVGGAPWANLSQ